MVKVDWYPVMEKLGIKSKRGLALRLQYPEKSVGKLFSKDYNPRIKDLDKHARKLGCKVRDLIKE